MDFDPAQMLLWLKGYGLLAVAVIAFLKGWIIPAPIYAREVSRADSLEAIAKTALQAMARQVQPPKE